MNIGGVQAALGAIAFLVVAGSFCACGDEDLTFVAGKRPGGIRAPNGAGGGATDDTGGAGGGGGMMGAATRDASSPDDDAASGTGGVGGVGGASQGTGGGAEPRDAERDVAIADVTDARGLVDRIEGGVRDAGQDAAEAGVAPNDAGPANVVFSFDTDGDFTPWSTLNDVNGTSTGGPLSPVNDEAVPGHVPARALGWTATFTAYETSVHALAEFARPPSWSGRTALHFSVRITSGAASLRAYQIYFQTGGPTFASRYLDEQPIAQIADSAAFHDVSVSLTNTTISGSVTFIGMVLAAGPRPAGAGAVPPPAVVEIDNIWLE